MPGAQCLSYDLYRQGTFVALLNLHSFVRPDHLCHCLLRLLRRLEGELLHDVHLRRPPCGHPDCRDRGRHRRLCPQERLQGHCGEEHAAGHVQLQEGRL